MRLAALTREEKSVGAAGGYPAQHGPSALAHSSRFGTVTAGLRAERVLLRPKRLPGGRPPTHLKPLGVSQSACVETSCYTVVMNENPGRLVAIAIRQRSRGTMLEMGRAEVTAGGGVAGDLRGRPGVRQVTVLSLDDWQAAANAAGRPELPWTTRRANLLVNGVELAKSGGSILRIGAVELLVTGETSPCDRMEEQCPGLRAALTPAWRGGVTCRVLRDGELVPGDPVRLVAGVGTGRRIEAATEETTAAL